MYRTGVAGLAVAAFLVGLTGCSGGNGAAHSPGLDAQQLQAELGAPSASPSSSLGLISAEWPACASEGAQLAAYLATGAPTSLDPQYGDDRQEVLGAGGASNPQAALYIRQTADQLISTCDSQEDTQAAQAVASASAAAIAAKAGSECSALGGSFGGAFQVCSVSAYNSEGGTMDAQLSTSTTGDLLPESDTGDFATSRQCASGQYLDGHTNPPGHWNSKYQICLP